MTDARAPRSTTIRLRGWVTLPAASAVVTKTRWTGRVELDAGGHVDQAAVAQNAVFSAVKGLPSTGA